MSVQGITRINGYEIFAVIPTIFTKTQGLPDTWYLVGQDDEGNAVCAATYDLTNHNSWSSGQYFQRHSGEKPGVALLRAYEHAAHRAGVDVLIGSAF